MTVRIVLTVVLALASLGFVLGKAWFLARTRCGWLMMFINVFYETFCRAWRRRWHVDAAAFVGLAVAWTLAWGPWAGAAWLAVYGGLWAYTLLVDLAWRNGVFTVQDEKNRGRIPLPLPKLIVTLRGPVLERGKVHDLGAWPAGRTERFEILILNPADRVHCQFPVRIELKASGDAVAIEDDPSGEHPGVDWASVLHLPFTLRAVRPTQEPVTVTWRLEHGSYVRTGSARVTVFDAEGVRITDLAITRWKGGARAAWTWRGDTDLYDPATWQSVQGLTPCFELSRRFRMPHTMLLSARLGLVEEESRAHGEHFGLDRRSHEIPGFVQWLRDQVHLANEMDWPVEGIDKPFFCELGNHYWLHYGTHSAADPGNQWKTGARPGQGRYPWSEADGDPLIEQRDNALKCIETFQELLDFTPTVWGIPGRANDKVTPQAIEAAGMPIASDSNCQAFVNVFRQPPPHHPAGTERLVELSKKYPGDPLFGNQLAMLKYWTWHARRHGRVMVFMAHHHLRGFEAASCFRLTEEMLREVLEEGRGDFYVATMTAVGRYWERVLCPKHRWVASGVRGDLALVVSNSGDADLARVPVEVTFSTGQRTLALVDVPAAGETQVSWAKGAG